MNFSRRSFFGLSLGALLARWLPKPNPNIPRIDNTLLARAGIYGHEIVDAENITVDGCVIRATDPSKPCFVTFGDYRPDVHQVSVSFLTKNGFVTVPSPPQKWTAASQLPIGPPNTISRILKFDS